MSQPEITFTAGANATPPDATKIETFQNDSDEHVQLVIEGTKVAVTKEWTFTSAQTNTTLVTASGSQLTGLFYSEVTLSNTSSGDPGFRLGFTTTTLSAASSSGVTGIYSSHPGLAQGGGVIRTKFHAGGTGEDVLFTCDAPVGTIRVVLEYATVTA